MWPRIAVFIAPIDRAEGSYRVTVRKGWWAGPGSGGQQAIIAEVLVTLRSQDERDRIREALRAAADAV